MAAAPHLGTAQDLAGQWQGVELNPGSAASDYWPSLLTLQGGAPAYAGTLYQEAGAAPEYTVRYRLKIAREGQQWRLSHAGIIAETNVDPTGQWCQGTMLLTYDAQLEKLSGRSAYPTPGCHGGTIELYRVRLKSAPTVPAGQASTLAVSGRNVRWFADAALTRPLASGNTYRTSLRRTTTFYILQGFYPTAISPAVPVTVRVLATAPPAPPAPAAPEPAPTPPAAAPPVAPLVLPAVLFRLGTAELLATSAPALQQLADYLQANPGRRVEVAGHTDRLGETAKNQRLSEERADAVRQFLTTTGGIAPGRISTVGYGDSRPLYPSPDPRNRRVEVRFEGE